MHINQKKEMLVFECVGRGVQDEHVRGYLEEQSVPDFDLRNLVTRLHADGIVSKENGYDDPEGLLEDVKEKKQRRTMQELDQMNEYE